MFASIVKAAASLLQKYRCRTGAGNPYVVVVSHPIPDIIASREDSHATAVSSVDYNTDIRQLIQQHGLTPRHGAVAINKKRVCAATLVHISDDNRAMDLLDALKNCLCDDSRISITVGADLTAINTALHSHI
ncbi:hypothetical protein ANMWB30_23960 [Arthrobacter sp. MWB30]|nr:hypothetical protein ANMWB30_23960 [Arthrobacter sp. MWB30]